MKLAILYRGPLQSCNYDCDYCPFAKHTSPADELRADRAGLAKFVDWARHDAAATASELSILFTPWGEALVRPWYRQALVELSHLGNVRRVAIQTNLSGSVGWLGDADRDTVALWTTFHPGQVDYARFLARCHDLATLGIRFSVGIVGKREHLAHAEALRRDLPANIYVWVNAFKSAGAAYYDRAAIDAFTAIDPLFPVNNQHHASLGFSCQAGYRSFTVDGDGDVRRCHFIGDVLGNLYRDSLPAMLAPRPCTNTTCGCHIGYVHLDRLGLRTLFGDGLMERIPENVRPAGVGSFS